VFDSVELAVGEELLLYLDGQRILVVRGAETVGVILEPPATLLLAIRDRCYGSTIAVVHEINPISHTARVALIYGD